MKMKLKKIIKSFHIKNLFNNRDVDIQFDNNVKILIGENGLGKTTVLNALYFLLTKRFTELSKIPFKTIELIFWSNKKIKFTKEELITFNDFSRHGVDSGAIAFLKENLTATNIREIKDIYTKNEDVTKFHSTQAVSQYLRSVLPPSRSRYPVSILIRNLNRMLGEPVLLKFSSIQEIIDTEIDSEILYYPTYRRIEEDLKNLGLLKSFQSSRQQPELFEEEQLVFFEDDENDDGESDDILIQFGMRDVENRIDNIKKEISRSSLSGFSKVSGELLTQLLKGFPEITSAERKNIKLDDIKIILSRVGPSLSVEDKSKIISLLSENKLFQNENKELVYFLKKLIEIYDEQRAWDESIKNFANVCNKYLVDKEIVYNESTVDLVIIHKPSNQSILFNQLSSGEKQIVSLFSKIYLGKHNFIILFDEPELSLSIKWQEQLLPDIINSGKSNFLLAVTHSPFIFSNELEKYAIGMNVYISDGEK